MMVMAGALGLSGCMTPPLPQPRMPSIKLSLHGSQKDAAEHAPFDDIDYANWDPAGEPPYRLYPGDELDMRTPYAPENNKIVTVGPDGRASFPLIGPVMIAQRSLDDVKAELEGRYARQLRKPTVELSVKAAPIKVFVGGEVANPGAFELIGDGDSLRAIMQAGGFRTSADTKNVVIIRRGKNGAAMMRTANMDYAFHHGWQPDLVPLRRDDVIFVPRSGVAKVGLFMQQYLRDALPVSFSYALGGGAYISR